MWNGSVYNIKNTLIIQFLNEIYRLLTKSFRFLPSRIRKSSCSYRPAESQRANACHSDRKTQLSGEQNNRLGDSMYEKLLLLIPRLQSWVQRTEKGLPAVQNEDVHRSSFPVCKGDEISCRLVERLGMRASDPYPRPRYRKEWRTACDCFETNAKGLNNSDLEIHRLILRVLVRVSENVYLAVL